MKKSEHLKIYREYDGDSITKNREYNGDFITKNREYIPYYYIFITTKIVLRKNISENKKGLNYGNDCMSSENEILNYIYAKQLEIENLKKNKLKKINEKRFKYEKIKKHMNHFLDEENEYYSRLIVMAGLRGIGKTTILYQLHEYLTKEKKIQQKDVFYLDVNDLKLAYNLNIKDIIDVYLTEIQHATISSLDHKIFLLIDEAHLDDKWARYARLLFDKSNNIFMVFTGSSALELNQNTDATRRITMEEILPCNFKEYLLLKYGVHLETNSLKEFINKRDENSLMQTIKCEEKIHEMSLKIGHDLNLELKKYIFTKSYPFAINTNEFESYRYINNTIDRVIRDDLQDFKEFNNVTTTKISQLVSYLATKRPGSTSKQTLSQALSLDVKTITKIFEVLEESKLIFSIHAYGSSGKTLKKKTEHFFSTPSIKSALNYRVKRYDLNDIQCYSVLIENMIASTLYNISKQSMYSIGLFYDAEKKGVDFLLKVEDKIIPIEVGIGKKSKNQITRSMDKYNAEIGILVSNRTSRIRYENNILYIPVSTFALI